MLIYMLCLKDALEVEYNLMASRKMKQRMEVDRRRTREDNQASTFSSTDAKFDIMMKTMDSLMEILALDNRLPNREYPEPETRNLNFRRPPPPSQIRHRDQRNPRNVEDQQIIPPFLEIYVDEKEHNDPLDNQIHHFHDLESEIYLGEEEHNMFS